ncbi:MAG: response regulator [Deltaproteobacteria bacterium]|nr:response regulator [Deltaproteobacteria bacterium]
MKNKPHTPAKRKATTASRRRPRGLAARLQEAEETLEAIRSGDVDALVIQGPAGDQVFTLKGADHRYRQLVETMNEGALMITADGTIVYANARFARLVRAPHERVLGSTFDTYVASTSLKMVDALLRDRVEGGTKTEAELIAADGAIVPVYLSAMASWDNDHQLTCVIATDLSEQKRTREMLAAERLTAEIVDQAAEGIVVCDLNGIVVRASQPAQRVTGKNPLLRPFVEAFPLQTIDDPRASRTLLDLALSGATAKGREVGLLRDEDEPLVLLVSAGPVLGSQGEPLGCVISFVDVTQAKRAAEERQRLLVSATQARVEAEAANRAKDEFLAMLGHELRNPLAPILTALELMKKRSDQGCLRERDVIERQVKHVVMLVNDLLDVSRIAQGKVELHRKPVKIADVIAKAIEACSPILEERRHELEVEIEPGLVIDGDEARLCQVISNLLTNAAKYTDRNGQIHVEAMRVGDEVVIIVGDSGMGIAPDLLPTLFERFVQGTRTIDRSEGGLGLGLSIVQSLVALHGGTVSVRSEGIGRGSEFEVRFPALDAAALELSVRGPVEVELVPAGGRKVLIVDDNTDAAEMLAEALAAMGHETRVAFDGPSGLDAAAGFVPDIAFLDIGLPAMDGYELARKMRSELAAPSLRLVALTGYGQDSDRQRSAEAGFDSHMVKPIDISAVASTIKRLT